MNISNVNGESESLNWIQVFFFVLFIITSLSLNELFQYGCIQKKVEILILQWPTRGGAEHPVPIDDEILSKDEFSR